MPTSDYKPPSPRFTINRGTGFHLAFENGWEISVQFGAAHYCANRNLQAPIGNVQNFRVHHSCPDAEIAIFLPDNTFFPLSDSEFDCEVAGGIYPDQVARLIAILPTLNPKANREHWVNSNPDMLAKIRECIA
jgi:hypothetical protein